MLRAPTSFAITTALVLSASCSLFSGVDDLEGNSGAGASAGAGVGGGAGGSGGGAGSSACTVEGGCVGCASCDAYCACAKPFAIDACKAAECPDAGTDASSDAAADAADATAADADAAPDHCADTIYVGANCAAINQPQSCVDCISASCCQEFTDCFADDNCAKSYACWQKRCQGVVDPNQCIQQECPCVLQAVNHMITMSNCIQDNCMNVCTF